MGCRQRESRRTGMRTWRWPGSSCTTTRTARRARARGTAAGGAGRRDPGAGHPGMVPHARRPGPSDGCGHGRSHLDVARVQLGQRRDPRRGRGGSAGGPPLRHGRGGSGGSQDRRGSRGDEAARHRTGRDAESRLLARGEDGGAGQPRHATRGKDCADAGGQGPVVRPKPTSKGTAESSSAQGVFS